jgi:hypothetical protein
LPAVGFDRRRWRSVGRWLGFQFRHYLPRVTLDLGDPSSKRIGFRPAGFKSPLKPTKL